MEEGGGEETDGSVIHRPGVPREAAGRPRSASGALARPPPVRRRRRRGPRLASALRRWSRPPSQPFLPRVSGGRAPAWLRGQRVGAGGSAALAPAGPPPGSGAQGTAAEPPPPLPPPAQLWFWGRGHQGLLAASAR